VTSLGGRHGDGISVRGGGHYRHGPTGPAVAVAPTVWMRTARAGRGIKAPGRAAGTAVSHSWRTRVTWGERDPLNAVITVVAPARAARIGPDRWVGLLPTAITTATAGVAGVPVLMRNIQVACSKLLHSSRDLADLELATRCILGVAPPRSESDLRRAPALDAAHSVPRIDNTA
jgi:hypothetical protein